jgi:hypothetical protein
MGTKDLYIDVMKRGGITQRARKSSRSREIPPIDHLNPFGGFESEAPSARRNAIPPPAHAPRGYRGDALVVLMLLSWVAVTALCAFLTRGCR